MENLLKMQLGPLSKTADSRRGRSVGFLTFNNGYSSFRSIHHEHRRPVRGSYPIDEVLPRLRETFITSRNVVLSAAPGAGKTTRVPIALLEAHWLDGKKLIMLEPRRLAARRAAQFMATQLGEEVGGTVGYRIRGETAVGKTTRIEVVTEGVLTRLLHADPGLQGVGLVVFDEFHERNIHGDLGLALTLDAQTHLRHDLRVLVMSATLDGLAVSRVLGEAPVIKGTGRGYSVETRYQPFPRTGPVEALVVDTVLRAMREESGDILVFLPGQREIRRVEAGFDGVELAPGVEIHSLFGEAGFDRQQRALEPASSGRRKVILSTSIAETSLTIDGVRVVVDAGLSRMSRFNPRRGMSGLVTVPVSQATADQRRGRAGRQQPGVCYRLWTEDDHATLARFPVPEILTADLAPMALDLAQWGALDGAGLRFIDPPGAAHLSQAVDLLKRLGALDMQGLLTPHGRAMAEFPVHPRLAHMILRSKDLGLAGLACEVAALLEDRDLLVGDRRGDIDLVSRLHALRTGHGADRTLRARVLMESRRLRRIIGETEPEVKTERSGAVLALAYPERIARRRGNQGTYYQMAGGTGAALPAWSLLAREEFLAIADVDGMGTDVRVYLASPLPKPELLETFAGEITVREDVTWDPVDEAVVAQRAQRLGAIIVSSQSIQPAGELVRAAMLEGVRRTGFNSLPWGKDSLSIVSRCEWLRRHHLVSADWPDLSEAHLMATLEEWLAPFLDGITRRTQLATLTMAQILRARLSFGQLKELDTLAPPTLTVPTGSRIGIDYAAGEQPVLAVRLQEMFGLIETPTIAGGKMRVLIHLLSPAGRPLAVTQDLQSFWTNAYPEVRKQMRGRYPKHHWPDDPLSAQPTRRSKTPRSK